MFEQDTRSEILQRFSRRRLRLAGPGTDIGLPSVPASQPPRVDAALSNPLHLYWPFTRRLRFATIRNDVVARATQAAPGMQVAFIAFPGTPFTSSHHFAAYMRGDTPLTSRLLKPVLLDGETADVADSRALPVYLQALFISQLLHFGDYGGMPLKIIWAALDVLTIMVIGSGLYLWFARRGKRARVRAVTPDNRLVLSSR